MPLVTDRRRALECAEYMMDRKAVLAVFCTASHWNTEAILLACRNYARKHAIDYMPVSIGMAFSYPQMPQAQRVTYSGDAKAGFLSVIKHMEALCGTHRAPYADVTVLPHLDRADPEADRWALVDGLPWLASVMFDARAMKLERNIELTTDYVRTYGKLVLVEGACNPPDAGGRDALEAAGDNRYVETAANYVSATGVDFLAADLGTGRGSGGLEDCACLRDRLRSLTAALEKPMLALHGASSLGGEQMLTLGDDGVVRVNMWTRIAREAGVHAAERLAERLGDARRGEFESCDSRAYINDLTAKAAEIMEGVLDALGYDHLK